MREDRTNLLRDAAFGEKTLRLEIQGRDIAPELDFGSDAIATKSTRGPAGKDFDRSLHVSADDLAALCKELLAQVSTNGNGAP